MRIIFTIKLLKEKKYCVFIVRLKRFLYNLTKTIRYFYGYVLYSARWSSPKQMQSAITEASPFMVM